MAIYNKTKKDTYHNKGVYDFAKTSYIFNSKKQVGNVSKEVQETIVKESDILKNAVIAGLDVTDFDVDKLLNTMLDSDIVLVLFLCISYNRETFFDTVLSACEKRGKCLVDKDSETLGLIMMKLYDKNESKEGSESMIKYLLKLLDKGVVSTSAVTTQNKFNHNYSRAQSKDKISENILTLMVEFEKSVIEKNIKTGIKERKNINKI